MGQFSSVSAGTLHTCGVEIDGSVACWGEGTFGETSPPDGQFSSVSAAFLYTCGVKFNGSVACWGDVLKGQPMPPEGQFVSSMPGVNTLVV